jgi:hypothetical protein
MKRSGIKPSKKSMKRTPFKKKPYRPLPAESATQERLSNMGITELCHRVAWPLMSRYVRMNQEEQGCITCGKVKPWQEMQAGHFKHAGKCNPVSYDLRNVNNQCHSCNGEGKGRLDVYAERLEALYGYGIIQELTLKKNMSLKGKDKRQFIYDVIADLKEKLKAMREEGE